MKDEAVKLAIHMLFKALPEATQHQLQDELTKLAQQKYRNPHATEEQYEEGENASTAIDILNNWRVR